jgi:hypothetical protein
MKKNLIITLLIACITHNIVATDKIPTVTLEDKDRVTAAFPKDFIDQNETLRLAIEDFPGEATYHLPESISMKEFIDYYDTAKELDKNAIAPANKPSLKDLVHYAAYSELLENTDLRKKILFLIHQKLAALPEKNPDVIYAKKLFPQYFRSSEKDFKKEIIELAQINNTESRKFQEQFLEQFKQNNWVQRLLKQDPNAEIVFALPIAAATTIPEDIVEVEYTIIKDPDTRLLWDQKKTQRHTTRNFTQLDDKFWQVNKKGFFKGSSFNWDKVYMMAYNNTHEKLAFAIPGKIAITPMPLRTSPPSSVINLKSIQSNAVCSHIAFSCDSNTLTCVIKNKIYIIDIAKNKITPVSLPVPIDILSTILISDTLLMIRDIHDITYSYNLKTNHLQSVPDAKIDYFVVCHPLTDKVLLLGLAKQKDGIQLIHEYVDIDDKDKDEHA